MGWDEFCHGKIIDLLRKEENNGLDEDDSKRETCRRRFGIPKSRALKIRSTYS